MAVRDYEGVVLMCTAKRGEPPQDALCAPKFCISVKCAGCPYLSVTYLDYAESVVERVVEDEDAEFFTREG